MSALGDAFKPNGIGEQLLIWGVVQQILGAAIGPGVQEITNLTNEAFQAVPLDPGTAAGLVARKVIDQGSGEGDAARGGLSSENFVHLVKGAGTAADLSTAVAAYQRKLIDLGTNTPEGIGLVNALTDAGIRPEWHAIIEKLTIQIPTGAEIMNAWLEGQITEAEAHTRWLEAGMDPTWFQTAYDANGEAPTPVQALELLNRGIIPLRGTGPGAVSYEQAFLEGPWRNKWLESFIALRNYYPPPRTVTAMYHGKQLTHDQAASYLAKQGLEPALIAAYLTPSASSATAKAKELSEAQIVALYSDKLLTRAQAITHLEGLRYTQTDADYLLQLHDVASAAKAIAQGVTNIRSLFENLKITEHDAEAALIKLEIPAKQATEIVSTWAVTQFANVRQLTHAEIVSAWYYELLTTDDALAELIRLGFDDRDAYIILSIRNKGPLKGIPKPPGVK